MALQFIPLSRSLHRPDMVAGCERKLFLSVGMIAFALGGVGLTWWAISAATVLWIVLTSVLRIMGKVDPVLSEIYLLHIRYRPYYAPRPYPLERITKWK